MKIALFSDTYYPEINGVATSTYNLCTTLKNHGHDVLVVTTNPFADKVTFDDGVLRIPGITLKKYYNYRASGIYNAQAAKIISNFRPEVVHSQTDAGIGMFGQLIASRFHIGIVYTFHTMVEDYAYYVTKGHFDRLARHLVRGFFRGKMNTFDEIIAPSDKIYDYLRSIGSDAMIDVIPTGIDFGRFSVEKEDKDETAAMKKRFGINPDDYVILSLGRIAKEKSIDVLLRGYASFLKKGEPCPTKFVITGWGPAEDELKELASDLGIADHVIFTGKCSPNETQKYYHLGDCFASASVTETQGLTFMEAMAAKLLVLARYDDNLVETIQENETGYFFFDENDFADKLNKVIALDEENQNRVKENALKAIDIYSMEHFYQNAIGVYRRVRKKNW